MSDYENALGRALMMAGPGDITTADMVGAMPKKGLARLLMEAAQGAGNKMAGVPSYLKAPFGPFATAVESGFGTIGTGASGAENIRRGVAEDDPWRTAGGVGELGLAGLSVLPATGAVGKVVMGTAPRAMAATVPFLGTSMLPGVADAKDRAKDEIAAIQAPPHLERELGQARQQLQEMLTQQRQINEQHKRSGAETQRQALGPINDLIKQQTAKIGDIEGLIRTHAEQQHAKVMSEKPLRERSPETVAAILAGGTLLAGGLPFAGAVKNRLAGYFNTRATNQLADDVLAGATNRPGWFRGAPNEAETAINLDMLRKRVPELVPGFKETAPQTVGRYFGQLGEQVGSGVKTGANAITGGLALSEASILPEQIDYLTYGPEHPTRQAAQQTFRDPEYWKDRATPFISGAGLGIMGEKIGKLGTPKGGLDKAKIGTALRVGEPGFTDDIAKLREVRAASQPVGPVGLPTGLSGTQGPGQPPTPTGGTAGKPTPTRPEKPRQANSEPFSYPESPQQERVQQAIFERYQGTRDLPTLDELRPHLKRDSGKVVVPKDFQQRLDNLTEVVNIMKTSGMPDDRIADAILKLMQSGKHKLPAIAAGALGIGAMQFGDEPQN